MEVARSAVAAFGAHVRSVIPAQYHHLWLLRQDLALLAVTVAFANIVLWFLNRHVLPPRGTRIDGSLSIVTGASSGIGEAVARTLALRGSKVLMLARGKEKLDKACKAINDELDNLLKAGKRRSKNKGEVIAFAVDCGDIASVDKFAKEVKQKYGIPNIIVNNAGAGRWLWFEESTPQSAVEMMKAPYFAAFFITNAFYREMLQRNTGHIVNVNSPAAFATWPGCIAYAAARRALQAFDENLHTETRGTGLSVTHCLFGEVETDYWDNNPGSKERLPKFGTALGGPLKSETCARAIANGLEHNDRDVILPTKYWFIVKMYVGPVKTIIDWCVAMTSSKRPALPAK